MSGELLNPVTVDRASGNEETEYIYNEGVRAHIVERARRTHAVHQSNLQMAPSMKSRLWHVTSRE